MKKALFFFIFAVVLQSSISAQREPDPRKDYFIYYLVSGQKYVGIELEKTDTSVIVQLEDSSKITIPNDVLEEIELSLFERGKTWVHNPNATRYLYAPSGFGLKKGEGYFQNTLLLLSSVSYGFTDYFTLGTGVELYTLFDGKPIYYLTPKVSFPIGKYISGGVGVWYLHAPQILDGTSNFSIFYGVGTFGSRETHATIGIGYGYFDEELAESPILTFNGSWRLAKRFALVTENWTLPIGLENNYETIYTFGIRYIQPQFTADISVLGYEIFDNKKRFVFPFFGSVISFGKKRFLK